LKAELAKGYSSQLNTKNSLRDKEKEFADLRVKMGQKKSPDKTEVESVPSDLSDDMWGELPKYQYQKYLEQQRIDKEER